MKLTPVLKISTLLLTLALMIIGYFLPKFEHVYAVNGTDNANAIKKIKGYKNWTKVSKDSFVMDPVASQSCFIPMKTVTAGSNIDNSPHKDKYVRVFVNAIGRREMMLKKKPKFPLGTIVVKEKLSTPDSQEPEILTVMIKKEKGFNSQNGDWEFLTFNVKGDEVTARGKLTSCQSCHVDYKSTDFITRTYLPDSVKTKLK